ncbi:bifunctional tRNA (guanine-N1-)-methyltransferase [Babesia duncani]|uniref:Bifunctional tRNA (Guanine-N1-)-methyltransferase n=1 Tax=Babesia duncani TaxID=323732 RepID=A0AAD9PLL6_9APIC|nr:bifunctional tRNA (guanine-N1-)-methyltransferase [Babesia duncani]
MQCLRWLSKLKYSRDYATKTLDRHIDVIKESKLALQSTEPKGNFSLPNWVEPAPIDQSVSIPSGREVLKKIRPFSLNQLSVFNTNPLQLSFPNKKNFLIKHIWKLRVNVTYRKRQDKRLVVGANVIRHMLVHTPVKFDFVLSSRNDLVELLLGHRSRFDRVQLVCNSILQYCLRGTTVACKSADAIAQVTIPCSITDPSPKIVLALDNIKYAQNIGDLVRIAAALQVDLIYYIQGTSDPFDWKVTSVTGGLQFGIPHLTGSVNDLCQFCKRHKLMPIVGHVKGKDINEVKFKRRGICLVVSNESSGPSRLILNFCQGVSLPMHHYMNSLNVAIAGAILLVELKSKFVQAHSA